MSSKAKEKDKKKQWSANSSEDPVRHTSLKGYTTR